MTTNQPPSQPKDLAELLNKVTRALEINGFRRCDSAACNCGGYHGGYANERLRELTEVLDSADCHPTQKTILVAVQELIAERDKLRKQILSEAV